jgi:hypothetical protein
MEQAVAWNARRRSIPSLERMEEKAKDDWRMGQEARISLNDEGRGGSKGKERLNSPRLCSVNIHKLEPALRIRAGGIKVVDQELNGGGVE